MVDKISVTDKAAEMSAATLAASKKAKDVVSHCKGSKSPPEGQSIKERIKSNSPFNGDKESKPPPKQQRQSMKKRIKSEVKSKTIDYAKSNPTEALQCFVQSNNPKRELALRAMGLKGKMKKGEQKKGKQRRSNNRKLPWSGFGCGCQEIFG